MSDACSDPRREALMAWLAETGATPLRADPIGSDASFRRYFRLHYERGTEIAMDAPPEHEDCRPFVHVAGLLAASGVPAPTVLDQDLDHGFLRLDDLGDQTALEALDAQCLDIEPFMEGAVAALVRWQTAVPCDRLPPYDRVLLQREADLFVDWYLPRERGRALDAGERALWSEASRRLIDSALAEPRVPVHRDYMLRNLMPGDGPLPGVIDFQSAVCGPASYDIVSLLRDAFVEWPAAFEQRWLRHYWRTARAAGVPLGEDFPAFCRRADAMAAQRHLKVIGIFARLRHRDGKAAYVGEIPRFFGYLDRELAALDGFATFRGWLAEQAP